MPLPYVTTSTLAWGSFILTPTNGNANGNAFIAEDFSITEGSFVQGRMDANGAPNGAFMVAEAITGRGTLQLASNTSLAPERGDEFSRSLRPGKNALTFFFTEIGLPKKQRDFDTVEVQFREKI
jgi:hypothetical protein